MRSIKTKALARWALLVKDLGVSAVAFFSESRLGPRESIIVGWCVVREHPRHFAGSFETQIEAQAKAIDLGVGYFAHFGTHQRGTSDFVRQDDGVKNSALHRITNQRMTRLQHRSRV
jgi:hypothetical protein